MAEVNGANNGNGHHGHGNGSGAAAAAGRSTSVSRKIESEGAVLMPGVYDALSAAIVQKTGFYAGFISGYAVSGSFLGTPDVGLLTPPEMAEVARRICASAPNTLFIADADTGGGNALNVKRTVQDLMAAGAAGCFLEDQAWPKKCGKELFICHIRKIVFSFSGFSSLFFSIANLLLCLFVHRSSRTHAWQAGKY